MSEPKLSVGSNVRIAADPCLVGDFARLAKSRRVGVVEGIFIRMGARTETVRVVFPKKGNAKERVEFLMPGALELAQ